MSLRAAVGIVIVAMTLGACTQDSEPSARENTNATATTTESAQTKISRVDLVGLWGADPATAQESKSAWARFDDSGQFAGFDGCNSVSGNWTLNSSGEVRVGDQLSTLIGCLETPVATFDSMTFDGVSLTLDQSSGGKTAIVRRDT